MSPPAEQAESVEQRPAQGRSDGVGGALPNLVVIGAQKCGTSGLHYHLSLHPDISMSRPKELNFFIEERNWPRGEEWYRRQFDPRAKVRGESSPNYTAYPQHQGVPERMHAMIPGARLIYIVRDPLQRIAAHWVHNYAKRREKGDLRTTLTHPKTSYLARSHYAMQLERFLAHYPREQVLVLDQADLLTKRRETLPRVFEFVGADPGFWHPGFDLERHKTSRKTRATRAALALERASKTRFGRIVPPKFWIGLDSRRPLRKPIERPDVRGALPADALQGLREDAERLQELTGLDLSSWSIWER